MSESVVAALVGIIYRWLLLDFLVGDFGNPAGKGIAQSGCQMIAQGIILQTQVLQDGSATSSYLTPAQ